MLKRLLVIVIVLASTFAVASGGSTPRLFIETPATNFVLGEAAFITETVEVVGPVPVGLDVSGQIPRECLRIFGPVRPSCDSGRRMMEVGAPIGGTVLLPDGKLVRVIRLSDYGIVDAGEYEIWTEYHLRESDAPQGPGKTISSNHVKVALIQPVGVDSAVFEKHHGVCNKITLPEAEILKNFPTSTYAGYALLGHGPSGSLREASALTPERRDLEWHVPTGAPPVKQEEWRKTARDNYEKFVKEARAFLCIHPDFSQQNLLRKELANALFNVDKPDEAWAEVEVLAKLEGQWADEAKACLKAKGSGKNP